MRDVSRDRKNKSEVVMRPDETGLSRSEVSGLIDEWIFSARDREIMQLRWLDGMKYDDISDKTGMSVRQIKTIVYKCEDRLPKHI